MEEMHNNKEHRTNHTSMLAPADHDVSQHSGGIMEVTEQFEQSECAYPCLPLFTNLLAPLQPSLTHQDLEVDGNVPGDDVLNNTEVQTSIRFVDTRTQFEYRMRMDTLEQKNEIIDKLCDGGTCHDLVEHVMSIVRMEEYPNKNKFIRVRIHDAGSILRRYRNKLYLVPFDTDENATNVIHFLLHVIASTRDDNAINVTVVSVRN